jgi:dihydrofolate synthase / folylpolyglutamate synthase
MNVPELLARVASVEEALLARWPESRIAPDLSRIERLMTYLGDPQRAYPVIHIAGTNGKTSTSRMIDSLLTAFGLRVGRYTSPHLESMSERISIEGLPIEPQRFLDTYDDIAPYLELVDNELEAPLTFFETMTGLAFAAFADAPVDIAVLECGLGGEWDATNVADGEVAVITPIGFDHMEYLGNTLTDIATTKSGIIKSGATAIFAKQELEAATALMQRAVEVAAVVAREGVEFGVTSREVAIGGQMITLQGLHGEYPEIFLPLHGAHQAHNAAIALAAVEAFLARADGSPLNIETVREGFASTSSPGRLEIVRRSPTIILDAAHNPHGAQALVQAMDEAFTFDTLVGVVAAMADKDVSGVLEALEPILDELVVTAAASPRAMAPAQLFEIAEEIFGVGRVHVERSLDSAIETALALAEAESTGSGVLITGSVVTVGQARALLKR